MQARRIIVRALGIALVIASACTESAPTDEPCPNGICGDVSGTQGGGTPGSPGDPGASGACVEAWRCTPWKTAGADAATRACADQNGCGTTSLKPIESASLPALDRPFFECKVFPILQQKCSQLACHGSEKDRALRIYARGRLRITGEVFTETGCNAAGASVPSESCSGSFNCICRTGRHSPAEKQANYDSARGFALDEQGKAITDPGQSDLVRQPVVGGKAHTDVHLFRDTDADYLTIKDWITGKALGTPCDHPFN